MAGVPYSELTKLKTNAFDMENMLTRAVHRVLSNNLYDLSGNSIEKPKVHFQATSNHAQVRLIAEQLCRRVERRYEKKLADELEKEKNKTERTLKQIKEEYREELEQKKREVAHERLEMEERIREKERTLQHMMDIRAMNKEGSLDVQRKVLENRQTELKLAAERLDKANEEFRKRMRAELEGLRLEWEKLALKEAEVNHIDIDLSQARIVQEMRGKIEEVTKENGELKRKMTRMDREMTEAGNRNEKLEEELRLTLFHMRDKESLGESVLVKEILEQNTKLKEDILRNEIRHQSDASGELNRTRTEYAGQEEAHLLKIREQKQIIELMNRRMKHLQLEKDYLKQELKEARREMFYKGSKKGKGKEKREREKEVSSSTESLSSSESSSLSNGSIEIANIKKRISSLDQMAKQLDASVEMFTLTSSHHRQTALDEDTFHGYDDFCRGIIKHSSHHSSPAKPVQPPERTETRENKGEAPSAMVEVVREKTPHPKVEEPKESDFARRLRERNEQINKRTVTLASEEPLQEPVSQENPLFQPASSAMADYMSMFMQPSAQPSAPPVSEVVLPDEILLDPVTKSDDDIDW